MSLLLDALKRAEDAKRAKAGAASGQVTTGSTDETAPTLTTDEKAADSGRRSERSNVRDEVPLGPELAFHLIKETEVEVNALVAGAVERPDRRAGPTARRLDRAGEEL